MAPFQGANHFSHPHPGFLAPPGLRHPGLLSVTPLRGRRTAAPLFFAASWPARPTAGTGCNKAVAAHGVATAPRCRALCRAVAVASAKAKARHGAYIMPSHKLATSRSASLPPLRFALRRDKPQLVPRQRGSCRYTNVGEDAIATPRCHYWESIAAESSSNPIAIQHCPIIVFLLIGSRKSDPEFNTKRSIQINTPGVERNLQIPRICIIR